MPEETKDNAKSNQIKSNSPVVLMIVVVAIFLVAAAVFAAGRLSLRKSVLGQNRRFYSGMMQGRGFTGRTMMGKRGRAGGYAGIRVSGQVSAINNSKITVKTSNKDVSVVTNDQTSYLKAGEIAKATDLKVNDNIVVVGQSNAAGEIAASLISIR